MITSHFKPIKPNTYCRVCFSIGLGFAMDPHASSQQNSLTTIDMDCSWPVSQESSVSG